jgi:hypothetical protein
VGGLIHATQQAVAPERDGELVATDPAHGVPIPARGGLG